MDASVALAWCFPDETSASADRVLNDLEGVPILVPSIWGLEVANAITVGLRMRRITLADVEQFVTLLNNLPIVVDSQPPAVHIARILPLTTEFGLTAYDAAYLELARRKDARVATLDKKLAKAALQAGLEIMQTA